MLGALQATLWNCPIWDHSSKRASKCYSICESLGDTHGSSRCRGIPSPSQQTPALPLSPSHFPPIVFPTPSLEVHPSRFAGPCNAKRTVPVSVSIIVNELPQFLTIYFSLKVESSSYSAATSLSRFSGFAVRRASSRSTSQTNLALQMTAWGPCSDIVTIPPPASPVGTRDAATPSMHSDLSNVARHGRTSRPPLHVCSSKSRAQPPGLALNVVRTCLTYAQRWYLPADCPRRLRADGREDL